MCVQAHIIYSTHSYIRRAKCNGCEKKIAQYTCACVCSHPDNLCEMAERANCSGPAPITDPKKNRSKREWKPPSHKIDLSTRRGPLLERGEEERRRQRERGKRGTFPMAGGGRRRRRFLTCDVIAANRSDPPVFAFQLNCKHTLQERVRACFTYLKNCVLASR